MIEQEPIIEREPVLWRVRCDDCDYESEAIRLVGIGYTFLVGLKKMHERTQIDHHCKLIMDNSL